ncbi:cyclopropane fatty acyl phospholipid synthase [Candidatus Kaiserbacteria bacterium]|nr:cyclopropane fatty acyl phospholipid synthase [Candidatus Kaiserbacteria bacterium]
MSNECTVRKLLAKAGITVNGSEEHDIQVSDTSFYDRVVSHGSLGLGEAYVDGLWDVKALDKCVFRMLRANLKDEIYLDFATVFGYLRARVTNMASWRPFAVGEHHYDAGNDLYERMLDSRMTYSCGYWKDAKNLEEAQEAKLDLICRKIALGKDECVLDIGCGWGSFLSFAAAKYDAWGTGLTVSKEQKAHIEKDFPNAPFEVLLEPYQTFSGKMFDKIVSVGMFEHVGYKNYRAYMSKVHSLLRDDGLFLLHTMGGNKTVVQGDPWMQKHIFPHGMVPSVPQMGAALDGLFVVEDWHNIGHYYDPTLMAWFENFDRAWPDLKDQYDDRFYRTWKYYLLACAGASRARHFQVWQLVLSKKGMPGGYVCVR